jgi:Mce-associated membrane protein
VSAVTAPPTPGAAGGAASTRRGLLLAVAAVLSAVAVLAAALAAVAAMRSSRVHAVDAARDDALAAVASGIPVVLSYDYRHLKADFARAEARLTPRFRKQYDATTAKQVEPLAAKYHATSSAQVSAAAVVDASPDRAVVLVFVTQLATNTNLSAPRPDQSRINVTVVRSGDRWLIDRLAPL